MKITRRQLAGAFTAAALGAQAPPSKPDPTPQELLKAAVDETARDSAAIAKLDPPMDVEPAFSFRAA
jgi:hypothetical protein